MKKFKLYENMWDDTVRKETFSKKADLAFKRALIKALKDNDKNLAKQVNDCTIICTDKVAAGTAVYEQGTIYVHTNLSAAEQMDNAIAAIKKALANTVTEAVLTTAADKKFKTALIRGLVNRGEKSLAKQIHSCDVISSSEIDHDAVSIKDGVVKIPTNLYSIAKIDRVIEMIAQAVGSIQQPITEETDDPYGYGPYKTFSDPDLEVGDYVLTTRPFSRGGRTYPAKITSISSKWIEYEISGFGFTDKGTKARPGSASDSAIRKAATHLGLNKKSVAEAQAAKYEILYSDRHTEIVDEDTMNQLVDELESFTRDDVLQIHRIYSNGKLGKTIWTEEEGLF